MSGWKMDQEEMLDCENIEKILSPHPLSFMGLQSLCIFLIVWGLIIGWLVNFSDYKSLFANPIIIIAVWSVGLLLVGIIASILTVLWRIFFLYLAIVIAGVGLGIWLGWIEYATIFYPMYTVIISIVGFLFVELFRRSHKYIITNQRIMFKGGVVTKEERTLRYDKITDINSKQGILGQIFSFGTIIPISQSGFGLGSDSSFAAGGIAVGEKKGKFFGLFGGGKEVQTPRTRSYYELHGVYPYKEVKKIVENLVQGSVITPYQQEQVKFQEQQVDLQKEMRDLLKKQQTMMKKPMDNTEGFNEEE
jgi:membrane protein YdbS with pleckstrin-like domain